MAQTPEAGIELDDSDLDALVDAEVDAMFEDGSIKVGDPATEEPGATADRTGSRDDRDAEADDDEDSAQPAADDEGLEEDDRPAPAGEAPRAEASAPAVAPAPAPAPAAIPGERPFQFKASGGVHTLSGAVELPDGRVVIAPAALPDFKRILASERELRTQVPTLQRQLAAGKTEQERAIQAATAEATAMQEYVAGLLAMSPDERWEALQQLEADIPKLQLEVKEKQLTEKEQRLAERERGPQPTPEEQQQQVVTAITTEMRGTYDRIKGEAAKEGLTKAEVDAVFAKWARKPQALLKRATEADPANGIAAGDWFFDESDLIEDLNLLAKLKQQQRPAAGPSASARNAAMNADLVANPIPPAPRPGAVVAGTRRSTTPKKMGAKRFRREFLDGKLDDPE